jgi:putative spermidine/putrescine transport system permease protein
VTRVDTEGRRIGVAAFAVPLLVVMLGFYVWPLLRTFVNSFHPFTSAGIDESAWTLANYARLADPYYQGAFARTARVASVITAITCVLAYPVGLYIVGLGRRAQALLLLVYMTPWLVNVIVKAFGWSLILGRNGLLNRGLMSLGILDAPLQLVFTETAIVIGLVHGHFLFVLLPLWAALSGLDPNVKWAAANLGATPLQVFARVTLPLTLPALLAGALINFTMNLAAFATPALLGGSRARVISFVAYEVNLVELNWPFGGAIGVALLGLTLVPIWLARRVAERAPRGGREPRHA